MTRWTRSRDEHLDGTSLAITPTVAGLWLVVDLNDPATALSEALSIHAAKRCAERIAAERAATVAVGEAAQ